MSVQVCLKGNERKLDVKASMLIGAIPTESGTLDQDLYGTDFQVLEGREFDYGLFKKAWLRLEQG